MAKKQTQSEMSVCAVTAGPDAAAEASTAEADAARDRGAAADVSVLMRLQPQDAAAAEGGTAWRLMPG